jgi:CheY-like chemotaxis protein
MHNGLPFSILVVDDDEDDRYIIDQAFLEIGYDAEVKKFINGKMLFKYLEQLEPSLYPSLIVMDNSLPGLDATDLLHLLKSHAAYQHIRVVILTTTLTPSKKDQFTASGAFACFEKGTTMEDVVRIVKELKNLSRQNSNAL